MVQNFIYTEMRFIPHLRLSSRIAE